LVAPWGASLKQLALNVRHQTSKILTSNNRNEIASSMICQVANKRKTTTVKAVCVGFRRVADGVRYKFKNSNKNKNKRNSRK